MEENEAKISGFAVVKKVLEKNLFQKKVFQLICTDKT